LVLTALPTKHSTAAFAFAVQFVCAAAGRARAMLIAAHMAAHTPSMKILLRRIVDLTSG